jgi:uncharacterized membrane protein
VGTATGQGRLRLAILALVAVLGTLLCLHGLDRSLWLDEFGTLWVVEGASATAWERALAFQGQSPFYYLLTWLTVHGLGESEVALRLPALVCGFLTIVTLHRVGEEIGGRGLGSLCAALGLTSALLIDASRSGRPYALALLMATITLLGFLRATRGAPLGRALFVLGGVGLFYAHYVLAAFLVGLSVAYLLRPRLRRRYPTSRFALDVGVQLLLCLPGLGHLVALQGRAESLNWIGQAQLSVFAIVLFPYLVPVFAGRLLRDRRAAERTHQAATVLVTALCVQVLLLLGLAAAGTPLTAPRYMITIAVPAVVLAARGAWLMLHEPTPARIAVASFALLAYAGANAYQRGRLGLVMLEDWRGAVERVDALHGQEPSPVLYRSGFIEDDQRGEGRGVSNAVLSPLRSPGREPPTWDVVSLPATWTGAPEMDAFLQGHVIPAVERTGVALVLVRGRPEEYFDALRGWLQERYTGRIEFDSVNGEGGMTTALVRIRPARSSD